LKLSDFFETPFRNSPDSSGNPTAGDGKGLARGIATDSRFPAPKNLQSEILI